jgi:4,4'-diaponeurosporenoate glycosyltransferase
MTSVTPKGPPSLGTWWPWRGCDAGSVEFPTLLIVAGWLAGWWLLWRVPTVLADVAPGEVARDTAAPSLHDVTVVVPARNEATNLPNLLGSLGRQDPGPAQVIVVDDASTDGTAEVARSFGATVVDAGELPPGWTGKSWACAQGASLATGSTLVFLDADVRLEVGGLAAVVAEQRRRGGVLSVQPYHRMHRAYERLSAVFNMIAVMGVGIASPTREGRAWGAFGPCVVCDTADYRRIGGHGSVRSEILEDLALGRAFAKAGVDVRGAGGRGAVEFRMYPAGAGQLVEGWSKNMASGSATIPRIRLLATLLWLTGAISSASHLIEWLAGSGARDAGDVVVGWFMFAVQFGVMLRQLGNFGWWPAVAYPVPVAAFVLVFFRSLWLTVVRRRVRWRGRSVALPGRTRRRRPAGPVGESGPEGT